MNEPNGRTPDPESVGNQLATELVKNLVILNRTMEENQKLSVEIRDALDQFCGHMEVVNRAMEIVVEKREEGKVKFTLADFADAMVEAADEIMPAEEDEPGGEDPLVGRQ